MNGEMYQMCNVAVSAKHALQHQTKLVFQPAAYEKTIAFHMLPKQLPHKAGSVEEWFEEAVGRGLTDVKFLTPVKVKDRNLLAFVNTVPNALVCYYRDGTVSCFHAKWEFSESEKGWSITYTEEEWKNPPEGKPQFYDNREEFLLVLQQIEQLATVLEFDNFASLFHRAQLAIEGKAVDSSELRLLPEKNRRLFLAASAASVFGGMGSWNDSPPYVAHQMNLEKEYERLSAELHNQLNLAVLYAVNQW